MTTKAENPPNTSGKANAALFLGWIIPGAGHMLLGKWVRGVLLFAAIITLFWVGLAIQGRVYMPNFGDPLAMLGFAGDLGAGGLYALARIAGWGTAPMMTALADYGGKFIVVAGLLNVIAAVDAHSLANGRKAAS